MIPMSDIEAAARINTLKRELGAVILAHNYQLSEVQSVADFNGDSLALSMEASKTDAKVLVFCGVVFMAETAKILSPDKTVLLPVLEAGCPMADMACADELRALKASRPGALVACYVNSSAEVKAESDVCVTSANALQIVSKLPADKEVIFVPDKNLGNYIQRQTGRKMTMWQGFCPVHQRVTPQMILDRRREFPGAEVLVHPECPLEVIDLADAALSTGGMCEHVKKSPAKQMVVATELGMIHRLRQLRPDVQFIPVSEQAVCPTMKLIRLPDILRSLERLEHRIEIPEDIRAKAYKPIRLMLDMS